MNEQDESQPSSFITIQIVEKLSYYDSTDFTTVPAAP